MVGHEGAGELDAGRGGDRFGATGRAGEVLDHAGDDVRHGDVEERVEDVDPALVQLQELVGVESADFLSARRDGRSRIETDMNVEGAFLKFSRREKRRRIFRTC